MSRLLLALWLLQAGPQGTGVVSGIVRSSNGTPTAGVRVYAVTYRDAVEAAKSPPALDSLTVTDAAGKYRLEIPPGRYHIASGSVAAPTYFPGTTDIAAARVITVAAGEVVSGIDFGSFVPASRTQGGFVVYQPQPPGNGVLSGVLRYPDGKPAAGINVAAVPSATGGWISITAAGAGPLVYSVGGQIMVGTSGSPITDSSGAFRIENLRPETYYIAAGFSDAPVLYPGTTDIAKAKTITTTNNSKIDALDFTVSPPSPGVSIGGKVLTSSGAPATGAGVRLRYQGSGILPASGAFGLPLRNPSKEMIVAADGMFTFNDVAPGNFTVEAMFSGIQNHIQNVVVTGPPINSLEFVLPIALLTGRILMEDGSPVPNPRVFADALVTTVNNPNIVSSTIFPITAGGTFTRLHEDGEFRFYVRTLPEEYEIKSMKFGAADLMKETLKITGKEPVNIEIRVAKRAAPPASPAVRVSGTLIDGIAGLPVAAGRLVFCCSSSGPAERFSSPLSADGSFEFAGIPPGRYEAALQSVPGSPDIIVRGDLIDVGSQGRSGLTLSTAQQFGQITATIMAAGNVPLPESVQPTVAFTYTGPMGRGRVIAQRSPTGMYQASGPIGAKYDVSVERLPAGYAVKSILGEAVPVTIGVNANPVVILIERR